MSLALLVCLCIHSMELMKEIQILPLAIVDMGVTISRSGLAFGRESKTLHSFGVSWALVHG